MYSRRNVVPFLVVAALLAGCGGPVALRVKEQPTLAASAKVAPGFTSRDHLGRPVSLDAALARGPVVLVFYRGHW
jgi:hypothetical protein